MKFDIIDPSTGKIYKPPIGKRWTYGKNTIDELLNLGVIDSFRYLNKEGNIYSVWPNAYNARERNMGWRIDYIFIKKGMEDKIKRAEYLNKIYGSDHCPYLLEIDD